VNIVSFVVLCSLYAAKIIKKHLWIHSFVTNKNVKWL